MLAGISLKEAMDLFGISKGRASHKLASATRNFKKELEKDPIRPWRTLAVAVQAEDLPLQPHYQTLAAIAKVSWAAVVAMVTDVAMSGNAAADVFSGTQGDSKRSRRA